MSHLVARICFIAHSYSGIRIREDRQEELDWPPSPGRLHEALLSAALLGVQRSASDREDVFKAFRWLERLPAPEIWAAAQDESLRTAPRLAIPQNNPKKNRYDIKPTLLTPTKKAVSVAGETLEVIYHCLLMRRVFQTRTLKSSPTQRHTFLTLVARKTEPKSV